MYWTEDVEIEIEAFGCIWWGTIDEDPGDYDTPPLSSASVDHVRIEDLDDLLGEIIDHFGRGLPSHYQEEIQVRLAEDLDTFHQSDGKEETWIEGWLIAQLEERVAEKMFESLS